MNYYEIIEELLYYYENKQYEDLIDRVDEIDDELVSTLFMSMYCAVTEDVEEALNIMRALEVEKFLTEERTPVLELSVSVLHRMQEVEKLEKVCKFFYERTQNLEAMFPFYDLKIMRASSYEEVSQEIQIIVSEIDDYTKFSYPTQYWILYELSKDKDERFYDFALAMDDEYLIDTTLYYNIIEDVKDTDQDEFIVNFIEQLIPLLECKTYNEISVYSEYVKSKYKLKKEITTFDLHVLAKVKRIFIDNYKICIDNLELFKESEVKLELLKILNKDKVVPKDIDNKVYYYLVDRDFEEALAAFRESNFNSNEFGMIIVSLINYDEELIKAVFKFLSNILNEDSPRVHYYTYTLEAMLDEGRMDLFEMLYEMANLEDNTYKVSYLVSIHKYDVSKRHYLYYIGQKLINEKQSENLVLEGKKYLLGWYYSEGDRNNFVDIFESIEEKQYGNIDEFLITKSDVNKDIFIYLLNKKHYNLALFYCNSFYDFLSKRKDFGNDLELAKTILVILDEIVINDSDKLSMSTTCIETKRGMYLYTIGKKSEALKALKESAYNSPPYCNCGVAALMTYYDYEEPNAYEINKKITLNTMNGKKLVGDDEYVESEFGTHNDVAGYYAYYALNNEEGFDLENALDYFDLDELDFYSMYYVIKIGYTLGYGGLVNFYLDKMKNKAEHGYLEGDAKYLEVLTNLDCPLYKMEAFYK